jgi:hypothetical protein
MTKRPVVTTSAQAINNIITAQEAARKAAEQALKDKRENQTKKAESEKE